MAHLASVDFSNQRLHCHLDTVANGLDPIVMYQEYMVLWLANASNEQNYSVPIVAEGNEPIGGGLFTPQRADLRTGWKIVPYDTSHTLTLTNQVVNKTDALSFAECFDRSGLTSGVEVNIDQGYKDVEIREVATGGALTTAQDTKLTNVTTAVTAAIEGSHDLGGMMKLILAAAMNKCDVTDNGDGTHDITFYGLDGVTTRFVSTADTETGARTIASVDSS